MDPIIRPATIDDAPVLLSMIHALARHHGDPPDLTAAALARDVFCTPPWVRCLIAHAPEPTGYAACLPRAQLQTGLRGLEMHHLYVAPDRRGTGLGRDLTRACAGLARAQGCDYLTVGTHPDNTAAQAFYATLGFDRLPGDAPRFVYRLT